MCALTIHEPVTCLYNNIMKTQVLPQEYKVIPVPKKGDLTPVKNYRPIVYSRSI